MTPLVGLLNVLVGHGLFSWACGGRSRGKTRSRRGRFTGPDVVSF
ncbi:hypothetical protein GZL_08449 [Streptomyces sp. 769]|nr:hypothetical protein GZL_08449 [Streptomyces sp. 769]